MLIAMRDFPQEVCLRRILDRAEDIYGYYIGNGRACVEKLVN